MDFDRLLFGSFVSKKTKRYLVYSHIFAISAIKEKRKRKNEETHFSQNLKPQTCLIFSEIAKVKPGLAIYSRSLGSENELSDLLAVVKVFDSLIYFDVLSTCTEIHHVVSENQACAV